MTDSSDTGWNSIGICFRQKENNQEIVVKTVKQYGMTLYYALEELNNNKEVVMAAVIYKMDWHWSTLPMK